LQLGRCYGCKDVKLLYVLLAATSGCDIQHQYAPANMSQELLDGCLCVALHMLVLLQVQLHLQLKLLRLCAVVLLQGPAVGLAINV
jgi:hypothetical protein